MELKKIESFKVNHQTLFPGLYVSRKDVLGGVTVTTFDIRFTAPNKEPCLMGDAIHTLEHLGATFLRNSSRKNEVIYFGPMGCKTGFYLVMFGDLTSENVFPLIVETMEFCINFSGEIPGATAVECGNYAYQNLEMAKKYAKKYLSDLTKFKRLSYQKGGFSYEGYGYFRYSRFK